jgi:hypothetical protein
MAGFDFETRPSVVLSDRATGGSDARMHGPCPA